MPTIEDLLHRRTDLSTFLVHFTRDTVDPPASAAEKLVNAKGEPQDPDAPLPWRASP